MFGVSAGLFVLGLLVFVVCGTAENIFDDEGDAVGSMDSSGECKDTTATSPVLYDGFDSSEGHRPV